ncbi:hypothetical protein ACOTSX_15240 [Bacillus velezensis]
MQSRMKLTAVKLAALVFLAGAFALQVLPHAAASDTSLIIKMLLSLINFTETILICFADVVFI